MKKELPYTTAWQVIIFDMQDYCESIFFKDWAHAQTYAKRKNDTFLMTSNCFKHAETKLIPIFKQPLTHDNEIFAKKTLDEIEEEVDILLFKAEQRERKEATKEKEN
ncbi:MAG: hypothetical protein CL793_06525 [Chloroflexi bacterium]|nr:hypothetical protein [Chloroflexota bacterium]